MRSRVVYSIRPQSTSHKQGTRCDAPLFGNVERHRKTGHHHCHIMTVTMTLVSSTPSNWLPSQRNDSACTMHATAHKTRYRIDCGCVVRCRWRQCALRQRVGHAHGRRSAGHTCRDCQPRPFRPPHAARRGGVHIHANSYTYYYYNLLL